MKGLILAWYKAGIWQEAHVRAAVAKGWITQTEADEILAAGQA